LTMKSQGLPSWTFPIPTMRSTMSHGPEMAALLAVVQGLTAIASE
jgi:hypothetical protein